MVDVDEDFLSSIVVKKLVLEMAQKTCFSEIPTNWEQLSQIVRCGVELYLAEDKQMAMDHMKEHLKILGLIPDVKKSLLSPQYAERSKIIPLH